MRWLTWAPLGAFGEFGHLVLRAGVGAMMVVHGWPKIAGGERGWQQLGHAMGNLGITFAPTLWGAAAALAEFGGGALLVVGFATRPAAAAIGFTMLVAALTHFQRGDGFNGAGHAMAIGLVMVWLVTAGAGRYSVDRRLGG